VRWRKLLLTLATFALLPSPLPSFAQSSGHASPASKTTSAEPLDLRQHPFAGRQPVEVAIGIYITNLALVEETREQIQFEGYLTLEWRDPRLALPAAVRSKDHRRTFSPDTLWTPALETANLISHRPSQSLLEADDDGNLRYVERSDTTISTSYELRKFPFDSQLLEIRVEPFLPSASEIRFASKPADWTGIDLQNAGIAAWTVEGLRYETSDVPPAGAIPAIPRAVFQIHIQRHSGFYVWKIFLPMILLAAIPWSAFWYDVDDFAGKMSIPLGIVLSLVAFQFSIARDLPRVGYVTFLDAVFLTSFVFAFLCIVEVTLVYILQSRNQSAVADKMRRTARWAFPAAYALLLLLLVAIFWS
jgi:Neurotransmitter-gated ion-channel ligand binding domain/Neurotransmitter-gated ion-channel transmembrane region